MTTRPFHPDGCAGLSAIGRLFFFQSLIIIAGGLFSSGWIVYGWKTRLFDLRFYSGFEAPLAVGLIGLLALSIVAFVTPLLAVHKLMLDDATHARAKVAGLAKAIEASEGSLLLHTGDRSGEQVTGEVAKLRVLREVYTEQRGIPTWPVDLRTLTQFVSVQVPMWLGAAVSIGGNLEKVGKFLERIVGTTK